MIAECYDDKNVDMLKLVLLQALIVPVFEYLTEAVTTFPKDKNELMELWKKRKIIKPFQ